VAVRRGEARRIWSVWRPALDCLFAHGRYLATWTPARIRHALDLRIRALCCKRSTAQLMRHCNSLLRFARHACAGKKSQLCSLHTLRLRWNLRTAARRRALCSVLCAAFKRHVSHGCARWLHAMAMPMACLRRGTRCGSSNRARRMRHSTRSIAEAHGAGGSRERAPGARRRHPV